VSSFRTSVFETRYEYVRAAGGVCIADEVQAGSAAPARTYWGSKPKGVIPDIVCMSERHRQRLPARRGVTTPMIASGFSHRIHFNTFGGNPGCLRSGKAVRK